MWIQWWKSQTRYCHSRSLLTDNFIACYSLSAPATQEQLAFPQMYHLNSHFCASAYDSNYLDWPTVSSAFFPSSVFLHCYIATWQIFTYSSRLSFRYLFYEAFPETLTQAELIIPFFMSAMNHTQTSFTLICYMYVSHWVMTYSQMSYLFLRS